LLADEPPTPLALAAEPNEKSPASGPPSRARRIPLDVSPTEDDVALLGSVTPTEFDELDDECDPNKTIGTDGGCNTLLVLPVDELLLEMLVDSLSSLMKLKFAQATQL
jgi:hypothetical protein